ncbi:MAG: hypothetical protein V7752_15940 [Halopseudomonas sp.]
MDTLPVQPITKELLMCPYGYLDRLEEELSYLTWRAKVHNFSDAEIVAALKTLKAISMGLCPEKKATCQFIDAFCDTRRDELNGLIKWARHNPRTGLTGDL